MFKMNPEQLNWNPYRDENTNPLQRQILDALLNSFEKSKTEANDTGFWQTGLSIVLCHYRDDDTVEPFTAAEVAEFINVHKVGDTIVMPDGTGAFLPFGHHRAGAAVEAGIEEIVVVPEYMDLRQMQIRYILENGEEYGQNMQVLIENTAQSLDIIQNMIDGADDYDVFIEQYGQDGQNLYSRNRFAQLKGDAVVSANDVVKLLGSDTIAKKSIEAAYKVLADEAAGIINREDVFNFPTPRMMGIFGTIVAHINAMDAVPPAMRDFYKMHLIAEITGDLVQLPSDDDDTKFEAKRKKSLAKGPRVTFSQLDGLRRTMTAAKKAATEAGDKFGIDLVQALKKAMGIKKEGDEAVEVAFNLKAALGSEKRCGVRWQGLVDEDGAVAVDLEGLTDFEGVPTALAEIDEKHKEKAAKDAKKEAGEGKDDLQEEVDAGADESGDELPPMEDAEEVDPEQASQDAVASFSTAMETIDATMQNLARYHKLAAKSLEEPEVDALESIFVATAKVLWQIKGTRKDVENLLSKANPKS